MALDITALFEKFGSIGGSINSINTYRGSTFNDRIINDLYALYVATDDEPIIDGFVSSLTSWQNATGSILTGLQRLATQTLITNVNADLLQPDKSLSTAIAYLIAQMIAQSETVKASVVGISGTSDGGNTGNPVFAYSTKTSNGLVLENLFAETFVGSTTTDAQSGGSSAGSETLTFSAQFAQSDPLNWQFPQGSGSTLTLGLVDASLDAPGGNQQWLTNGDFETFTVPNIPDGWHIATGTAGTQVVSSSTHYTGAKSVGLVGDGTTLSAIYQEFSVDNSNTISPLTQYAFNLWVKATSVPASGVLEIALVDGSGTVIQDEQGTDNKVTKNLTSVTTTFAALNGSFRLPRVLPASVRLRVRFSTACPSGSTILIDRLSFTQMVQPYLGGPYVAAFSGSANTITGDLFSITTTNTRGGFQTLADRLWNMRQLQQILPSSNSPTQSDSLID